MERPHVIYNSSTATYVMYMHIDNSNYSERKAGVATSSSVCGSYTYRGSSKPLGHDSLDDNLFLDGGTAYFLSEDRANTKLQIYQLSADFLSNVSGSATTVTLTGSSDSASLGLVSATFTTTGNVDGTQTGTKAAIALLDTAIQKIGQTLTQLGAGSVQLQGLKSFTDQLKASNTTSLGSLVDANLSEESAKLSSLQTKQSLAIQSLSIANQGPGALLQLFR